jgi:uncharacterized protein YacL
MPKKNPEVERLIRIRDKQLQARDPQKKASKTQHNISTRYRRSRKPVTAKGIFSDIPKKWTGFVIGLFLGFFILILLPFFVDSTSTDLIGFGVMAVLALLGLAIGQAADAKYELEDLIR